MIEEALLLEQLLEPGQLRLGSSILDRVGLVSEFTQFLDFMTDLVRAPGKCDRLKRCLQPVPLTLFHLFQLFRIGEIGRREPSELLGTLEAFFETSGAVLK